MKEIIKNMKYLFTSMMLAMFSSSTLRAQETVRLWEQSAPTDNEITEAERYERNGSWVTQVSVPELMVYRPALQNNTGGAVVICPGGGYAGLAIEHEGRQFAEWLKNRGITAVVLKYRMPNQHKQVPLEDVWQAIRYVRQHASVLGVRADKVGIAGFSAGGHLASTASTYYATEGVSTRPDFSVLFYPVVTMGTYTHQGSLYALLGVNPSEEDIRYFSNEQHINADTPPAILLLSHDDKTVSPLNSMLYYQALLQHQVPAALYVFPTGGHGWGMNAGFAYHNRMLELLGEWLQSVLK
jgi:hypothetical protein